jgi:hypothetical protein
VSTADNKELQKTSLASKIQCGLIFGDFLIIGSTALLTQPRRERYAAGERTT